MARASGEREANIGAGGGQESIGPRARGADRRVQKKGDGIEEP